MKKGSNSYIENSSTAPQEQTSWKSIGSSIDAARGLIMAAPPPWLGDSNKGLVSSTSLENYSTWLSRGESWQNCKQRVVSPVWIIRIRSLYQAIGAWQCVPQKRRINQNLRGRFPMHWKKRKGLAMDGLEQEACDSVAWCYLQKEYGNFSSASQTIALRSRSDFTLNWLVCLWRRLFKYHR